MGTELRSPPAGQSRPSRARGQKIGRRQMLGGQNPVHRLQRELPPAVQEIGQMRLPEARLAGQQRDAERSPLYPAQQFQAEALSCIWVKFICGKFATSNEMAKLFVFLWKSY